MPRARGNGENAHAEKQGTTPDIVNRRKRTCAAPVRRKRGGQYGNKNAVGHGAPEGNQNAVGNSGGAPEGNNYAETHGLFRKYLPQETLEIVESVEKNPLDILWNMIKVQYAAIIRAQEIMYVKNKDDHSTTQIGFTEGKTSGETWQVQYAWDKQASFLTAQSRAIAELRSNIRNYLELEGMSKADAKDQVKDWKVAIVEIAKRRGKKNEGTD